MDKTVYPGIDFDPKADAAKEPVLRHLATRRLVEELDTDGQPADQVADWFTGFDAAAAEIWRGLSSQSLADDEMVPWAVLRASQHRIPRAYDDLRVQGELCAYEAVAAIPL